MISTKYQELAPMLCEMVRSGDKNQQEAVCIEIEKICLKADEYEDMYRERRNESNRSF